jgi:parvulin-like peptidyl-prolyl isomerase
MNSPAVQELPAHVLALLRRHNLLAALVHAELISEAVRDIPVEPAQGQELLRSYCERNRLEGREQLAAHLQQLNLSEADLLWQVELPVRIHAYSQEHFRHKAEARFLARKEQLDRVVYSLLRVKDPFLARELYLQISSGEANFADLAAEFAEGPERGTKGIVGPAPLTQAHPALAERLRTSKPGQLMEPFQIAEWCLVARLERYEPARFDDAVAQQMTQELFQAWAHDQTAAKVAQLTVMTGSSRTE